ncbi:MAG: tetratricopeptide repeat protein [Candidatus Paceibacterota bacterium]
MNTKNFLLYTVVGGLFIVPIIPFIVTGTMFFPFIVGKGFFFRILIEIIFGAYLLLAIIEPSYRPKLSLVTKSIGVFALVILLADLLGENPFKSFWSNFERMEGYILILHLVIYYIVATGVFRKISDWDRWFSASLLTSLAVSLYSLAQIFGKVTINQGGVRVDATFGNSTYLAIYLVFHIFLALYMVAKSKKGTWQMWVYSGLVLLETVILYYTATRGAILGLIGGLLVTGLIVIIKEKENKKLRKISFYLLGGIFVVVALFMLVRNTSFVQQSPVLSRFATLSPSEIKTQGRYFVWPMALKGVAERPLLGWGQENFNYVFNKNYDPRMYAQEQWFDRTHNIVLDWLIAGGIVGFLSYAGLYFALLYCLWKGNQMSTTEKALFTGMISAYVFHNIFVFDNLVSYVMFFSVLGFAHTSYVKESKEVYVSKVPSPVTYNYAIVPVVMIFTALFVYYVNVPAILTNKTLIQAMSTRDALGIDKNLSLFKKALSYNSTGSDEVLEQLVQISSQVASSAQVSDQTKQNLFKFTQEALAEKIKKTPDDARYYVFAGGFFNRINQQDLAIQYLNRAIELSPKKQTIIFELGAAYLAKGDTAKAMELFKKAYDLEQDSPESQIIYALGGIYSGNKEIVDQMFAKLGEDRVLFEDRIVNAYANVSNYDAVISILKARIQKDPANHQNRLSLASVYVQTGNKQKAIDLINEVIKLDPTFKDQGEQYIKQIQGL